MEQTIQDYGLLILLTVIGVCGGGLLWIFLSRRRVRREAFRAIANRLGMDFIPKDHAYVFRFPALFDPLPPTSAYCYNIIHGLYRGMTIHAFDCVYIVRSDRGRAKSEGTTQLISCFAVEHQFKFPMVTVQPKSKVVSGILAVLGAKGVQFESIEFTKAFHVNSADAKTAYAILHPRMMEYLLTRPTISVTFNGGFLALPMHKLIKAGELEGYLDELIDIAELLPEQLTESFP